MNNNKTMGLQPGRISGGAAKMIQDHYSAGPLKPETAAEKAARLAAEKKSSGEDSGLSKELPNYDTSSLDTKITPPTSSSSSTSNTSNYDAAVKAEGTNIVDPSKITPEMTRVANQKRADAKKLDAASNSNSSSSSTGGLTETKSTVNTTIGEKSADQINKEAIVANKNVTNKLAASKENQLNLSRIDSTNVADAYRNKVAKNNNKPYLYNDPKVIENATAKGNRAGQVNLATAGYHANQEIRSAYTSPSEVRKGNTGTAGSKGGILTPQKSLKQKYGMRK